MATVSIWELSGPATELAMVVTLFFYHAVGRIPVNELAMNFASQRVDDGYLKVLVVAEAVVAKVLRKHPGVRDCFNVAVELNSNPVSHWNAILHIEEKRLHCHHLVRVRRALA
jgi:predicted anti-sigma-YlaC factor YlaD